jgi:hypothetical protein
MTQANLAAHVRLGTIAFVVSACSGSADGTRDLSATIGGNASNATGGQSTSSSSGGDSTGGKATGGIAAVGGAATIGTANGGAIASGGGNAIGGSPTGGKTAGGAWSGGAASVGGGGTSGNATGGNATGGKTIGSSATGGVTAAATGGRATGGSVNGGAATGGKATGGSVTGEAAATGGRATGGSVNGGTATGGTSGGAMAFVLPTANASFDYQIGGAYTPPSGVKVVSRDRNSAPAAGLYNICYVNGYQAQPDEDSFWTSQHPTLILKDSAGNAVVDADWGEMLLDTSTDTKRTQLAAVVGGWITQCKTDGYNAVEIDNLDSYSRSNGLLTQTNNIAFMALLSGIAHQNGLAIAQKNSSELLGSVAAMGTDFAVVEECNRYSECDTYKSAYGNLIFIIEYRAQDFQVGCSTYPELSIVLRDLDVSTPGSSTYVYQGC